jgi:hypothetical protein
MSTLSRLLLACGLLAATLSMHSVQAGEPAPGAQPGDEALTCEQIYAQGAAESQREQQERDRKNDERRQQQHATAALLTGAMLTSGVPGAGRAAGMAANQAAQNLADKTMADAATAPPPNLRKERLRQLWTQKQCVKK